MARKVMIYKGPLYRVFASDITLVKDKVVPKVETVVEEENSLFYRIFGGFINLDYSCPLPDDGEAENYLSGVFERQNDVIKNYLTNPEISEEEKQKYFEYLDRISSCIFYDPIQVEPSHLLSKKDFKILKKNLKKENHVI